MAEGEHPGADPDVQAIGTRVHDAVGLAAAITVVLPAARPAESEARIEA